MTACGREIKLGIWTQVPSSTDDRLVSGEVVDGMGALSELELTRFSRPKAGLTRPPAVSHGTIAGLPSTAGVRNIGFPAFTQVTVGESESISAPAVRAAGVRGIGGDTRVRCAILIQQAETIKSVLAGFFVSDVGVREGTPRMQLFPHICKSHHLDTLSAQEYQSFLREAEILRGVTRGQGELLGVFRHVPVEIISKIRYLEKRKAVLYTLTAGRELKRTRVHDLAVVRDLARQTTQMVAHRTRYRTVFLT